jgi:DNA-binding CsgD family transcriptional regulator
MSVLPDSQGSVLPQTNIKDDEALVFAAASITRQMARPDSEPATREVTSNGLTYRLEGRRLHNAPDSVGPIVLVFVGSAPKPVPDETDLCRQFGFTRKEVKVAILIAEGLSNEAVAAALSISTHTARHHTERVLAKLGLRSRSRVKAALLTGRLAERDTSSQGK